MAVPVLKCPFLSKLTVQQVRASAPHILNTGVEACPIFSQVARKISTSNVQETSNASTASMARPMSIDEIKAVHEKLYEQAHSASSATAMKMKIPSAARRIPSAFEPKKPSPYGEGKYRVALRSSTDERNRFS